MPRPSANRRRQLAPVLATVQGVIALVFGVFLLVILVLQRAMLASMTHGDEMSDVGGAAIGVLHGVWLVHAPILTALGALALAGGATLFRQRRAGAGTALVRLAATLTVLWVVGYGVHVWSVLPAFLEPFGDAPDSVAPLAEALALATMAGIVMLVWIYEMALLWALGGFRGDGATEG